MSEPELAVDLRLHRTRAGLTQAELAARVGLSRQAIHAIEAGRQVPSTTVALSLSRVLRCRVEDLFALPGGPRLRAVLAAGEPGTARVALGQVDGRWVAHPLAEADRPADGLRVEPPRRDGTARVEALVDARALERHVLVAGCAPLLGLVAGRLDRRHDDARATWLPADSSRALDWLAAGHVHVAGLHLVQARETEGHGVLVQPRLSGAGVTVVNLTRWRQGLVVAPRNPRCIHGVEDLLRPDVRAVRRASGSGAHRLLERLLEARGLDPAALPDGPVAAGHGEVARLVALGLADTGVAIESAALAAGLSFIPLAEERFDLVTPSERLSFEPVTALFELLDRPAFRAEAGRIPGYDLSTAGHARSLASAPGA